MTDLSLWEEIERSDATTVISIGRSDSEVLLDCEGSVTGHGS